MKVQKTTYRHITHYIPPAENFNPIIKEFVEPRPDDYWIFWLYRYRCAECRQVGQEINEIKPRGRSKKNILDWKNRILLCRNCHTNFHDKGVSDDKIERMQNLRKDYLLSVGREAYV